LTQTKEGRRTARGTIGCRSVAIKKEREWPRGRSIVRRNGTRETKRDGTKDINRANENPSN
jgi:hypothetical protein